MSNVLIPNIKIGVLQSGKLLHEIVIDDKRDVYIGTSLKSTITMNGEGLPDNVVLIKYMNGQYYLNILEGFSGKIFDGDKTTQLDNIKDDPDIIEKGGTFFLPMSDDVRGMITLKDHMLLFKIYSSEAVPKELPKEFKGPFFGSDMDVSFFIILSLFIFGYIFLTYSFSKVKHVEVEEVGQIPERFARLIMNKPIVHNKETVKSTEQKPLDKKVEKKENEGAASSNKKRLAGNLGTTKQGGKVATKSSAEVVRSAGIIGIIGSRGSGGTVANLFQQGGFEQKLDKALKGVSGLYVAKNIEEAKMKKGTGVDSKGVDVGALKTTTGSGLVAFGSHNAAATNIVGNIKEKDMGGEGKMNPNVVARTLSQHVSAFQYCYNKSLQNDPKLNGELKVRFVIKEDGSVDGKEMEFEGSAAKDGDLTSCVQRVFSRMKFPSPKGGEVVVNYPLNFMAQN